MCSFRISELPCIVKLYTHIYTERGFLFKLCHPNNCATSADMHTHTRNVYTHKCGQTVYVPYVCIHSGLMLLLTRYTYVCTATVGKYNILQGICVRMHKNILLRCAESTSITAYRFGIRGKDSEAWSACICCWRRSFGTKTSCLTDQW